MVKTSTQQGWRKHSDLLFWTDLKCTWKIPTFIHYCSFEVSLPIFSNPVFTFLGEFEKIGMYNLGKYSKIPIIHFSKKMGKIWKHFKISISWIGKNWKVQLSATFKYLNFQSLCKLKKQYSIYNSIRLYIQQYIQPKAKHSKIPILNPCIDWGKMGKFKGWSYFKLKVMNIPFPQILRVFQ